MPEIHSAIQAIVNAAVAFKGEKGGKGAKPVVTISRDHGTMGDEIAQLLAGRLGVPVYSKEILEKITQRSHLDPAVVKTLDESVANSRDLWLYRLFTGEETGEEHYKKHMVNVILSLGRAGGVIIGRGAHVVLGHSHALRVRITGSPDICAQRVAEAEGINIEQAKKQIQKINRQRGKFVWDAFQSRLNDPANFDLTLNTDRLNDKEYLVETLVDALKSVV